MKREQAVALLRYVRTADKGWTRRKVPTGGTRGWEHRLDVSPALYGADVVILGEYQLRWREHGKEKYESAGTQYVTAKNALRERQSKLNLVRASAEAGVQPPPELTDQKPLRERLEDFLKFRVATKRVSDETCRIYRTAVGGFLESSKVRYPAEVSTQVLTDYLLSLQERHLSAQTQLNLYNAVAAFLRWCDADPKILTERTPHVQSKKPQIYTSEEINTLISYLNQHHKYVHALAVETFWKTGLRERELAYLTWEDVDLRAGFIAIKTEKVFHLILQGKPRTVIFNTKTRKDRDIRIPIETSLRERLKEWHALHPNYRFLFPTKLGNPDRHLLGPIKAAAFRAGLACGTCEGCLTPCGKCKSCLSGGKCTRIECHKWRLHRFRHTFASRAISRGVPVHMLMHLLGHNKLTTTQIYLSVAEEKEAQQKIEAAFTGD